MEGLKGVFGEDAARDSGLVGDDDEFPARASKSLECADDARQRSKGARVGGIFGVLDDGVVAVEEDGFMRHGALRSIPFRRGRREYERR